MEQFQQIPEQNQDQKEQEKSGTAWYLTDPNTNKKSVSLTLFVLGFLVACGKLIFSGVEVHGIVLSPFTGLDFGAVVAALGAVYSVRRNSHKKGNS